MKVEIYLQRLLTQIKSLDIEQAWKRNEVLSWSRTAVWCPELWISMTKRRFSWNCQLVPTDSHSFNHVIFFWKLENSWSCSSTVALNNWMLVLKNWRKIWLTLVSVDGTVSMNYWHTHPEMQMYLLCIVYTERKQNKAEGKNNKKIIKKKIQYNNNNNNKSYITLLKIKVIKSVLQILKMPELIQDCSWHYYTHVLSLQ